VIALAIRIVVTAIFFGVIWYAVDVTVLWETVRAANPWGLLLAVLLISSTIPLFGIRWLLVNRLLLIALPLKQSIVATAASHMLNQTLPSTIGADGYRLLLLRKMGHSLSTAFSSVLLDRASGIIGLVLLILLGQPFLVAHIDNPLLTRVSLGIQISILFGFFVARYSHVVTARLQQFRITSTIENVMEHLNSRAEAKTIIWMVVISFVGQSVITGTVYVIGLSMGLELDFWMILFVFPPVYLLSMLPITIAGWGVREGSMIAALTVLGTPGTDALALSILFGGCMFAVGIIGGLIWLPSGTKLS
jgi:uncharacterized protein (TIRG00374 family)